MAKVASAPKSTNRSPKGIDKKSTYPLSKAKGLAGKGANKARFGKKPDKRGTGTGVTGERPKRLEGKYF